MARSDVVVFGDLPDPALPLALAELRDAIDVGNRVRVRVPAEGRGRRGATGRRLERLPDIVAGDGFHVVDVSAGGRWTTLEIERCRSLADIVGPAMRVLIVGLNPSEYAADAGVPFARPGNRFWPAALRAGLVTRDRDPRHALAVHGVGFTDLVKRATPRAASLGAEEYRAGGERLGRLVGWLAPGAVCFAGLAGYRAAFDRRARTGWQADPLAGRPVYVMANPSGLNAHTSLEGFVEHLRAVADAVVQR
jgi:double-stranded uracil-DNA glycosylase